MTDTKYGVGCGYGQCVDKLLKLVFVPLVVVLLK